MLAHDFKNIFLGKYKIFAFDSKELNITNLISIKKEINNIKPDIVLNFAAYTKVDDAEDIWKKINMDVNALWVYNLAKITAQKNIEFITISTDYVFSWENKLWYNENDSIKYPVNQYGMAKYLWEQLALSENHNTVIIRTSWLYWWWIEYRNFVNTMILLWNKLDTLNVINDQFWSPTNCKDLSLAIWKVIKNIWNYRWKKLHFSNSTENSWISWYDFAKEIFTQTWIKVDLKSCNSSEFPTKAKRPTFSKLINNSNIYLRGWKEGLKDYLNNL